MRGVKMKAKKRTIRWTVDGDRINVSWGRIKYVDMASFSFNKYNNVTSSTQKRILRIIAKFGSKWIYTIHKEGYNEIDLWYKEHSESHDNWLLGRDPSKARLV
jgi:hypothetical protein